MKVNCFKCEEGAHVATVKSRWHKVFIDGEEQWVCPTCAKPKKKVERSKPVKPETREKKEKEKDADSGDAESDS